MVINTKETIEKCPYSCTISEPPFIKHTATFVVISFVERGECEIEFFDKSDKEPKTVVLKENDCFVALPFMPIHFKKASKPYLHRNIHVDEEVFKSCCDLLSPNAFEEFKSLQYPPVFSLSAPSLIYFAERCSIVMGEYTLEKSIIHKSLVCEIISSYASSKIIDSAQPLWIKSLIRKLENNDFLVQPIDQMVKSTNYSHGYVNREFKKYLGMPLKKYVIRRKLNISSSLLATTDMSMQDIVDQLDFCTTSNFITLFKEQYNTTPSKYRKTHGNNINLDTYQEWGDFILEK